MITKPATQACANECGQETTDLSKWWCFSLDVVPPAAPSRIDGKPVPPPIRRPRSARTCSEKCGHEWIAKTITAYVADLAKLAEMVKEADAKAAEAADAKAAK